MVERVTVLFSDLAHLLGFPQFREYPINNNEIIGEIENPPPYFTAAEFGEVENAPDIFKFMSTEASRYYIGNSRETTVRRRPFLRRVRSLRSKQYSKQNQ